MENNKKTNIQITHRFVVRETFFKNHDKIGKGFSVKPVFSKKITNCGDGVFDVCIKVEIKNTEENPFPFDLLAAISLVSTFSNVDDVPEQELQNYLNVTSVQLLFPYLRSIVTNLTTSGMVNPLVLPVIDVNAFLQTNNN